MKNCVKVDQLSQYVDQLLSEHDTKQIESHLAECDMCKNIVKMLEEENDFLRETLKSPSLPEDFASVILDKLEPYEQKSTKPRKKAWNRLLISAAGVALAIGVTTTVSPSFAELVGGIFGKEVVDDGLKMANEAGLAKRVDLSVSDKGLTFKIEDVIADSSRIAISYQVLNEKGIPQDPALREYENNGNEVSLYDQNGKKIEFVNSSYTNDDGYALLEFSMREHPHVEAVTIKFNLIELDGVKGKWQLELPVDLKENSKLTKTFALQDVEHTSHGVNIKLDEVKLAPSSGELAYETSFTKDELNQIEDQLDALSESLGKKLIKSLRDSYQTSIGFRIEDANSKSIFQHQSFVEDKGHPINDGGLQGSGTLKGKMGHIAWDDSFIPTKNDEKLTFVLDGIFKTIPSDFTVKVKADELKREAISFEYEGLKMAVKEAKIENSYSLQSDITPINKETALVIVMEGGREAKAPQVINWVLVDDKGNAYQAFGSGGILDEKTKDGLFKTNSTLEFHGIKEVPKEFTLHAVTVTKYVELDEKWKVPLN